MFAPLVSSDGEDSPSSDHLNSGRLSVTSSSGYIPMESTTQEEERIKEKKKSSKRSEDENGFELATVRSNSAYDLDDGASASSQSSSLIRSEHFSSSSHPASAASSSNASSASSSSSSSSDSPHHAAATSSSSSSSSATGGGSLLSFELLSLRLKNLMMEDASETAEEELEMTDYDNPEDAILERKFDEDGIGSNVSSSALHHSSSSSVMGGSGSGMHHSIRGGSIGDYAHWVMTCGPCSAITSGVCGFGRRDWRKLRLTFLRMLITIIIGICIGLTGFAVSRTVSAMIHANLHILNDLMGRDRPAAAFFVILIISCIYTGVAALFVTFGSWQTRGSGVGRLNAYLSGMSSSKFLALKTLFVKIGGLVLNVSAGIKQGMEGPFIHIGAMIGLHVSRFILWILNLCFSRWGVTKYTQIVAGVVDERMFISGGAAAGFSVAFNAPIAGVLYVQDGAFAYWQGEYTIRTFLCTMTAVTTINMCWKEGDVLPSRGLIDVGNFLPATITLQEFWGFVILGIIGGCMGIIFTKCNVLLEKFRHKYLAKLRLHNVLDVLACTVLTFLLSFILPFMLGCHRTRYDEWCTKNPDRCLQFQCGPGRYSDLATFFFTLPEETIRILFDRTPTVEAQIPYETLIVFCIFYTLMACISYGMAVPGGLFIPGIISGAAYGRLVGLAVQYLLPSPDPSASAPSGTYLGINPGVYAVLGSASMLGGITRMTLPISVMMIEVTSDAQFLIPIMLVVLIAKVVADFGCGALYAEHLKLDGLVMVFGDRPPPALKQLLAKDVMSSRSVRKLTVISTVADAWAAIKETRHNAFPVTDSSLATLRSILIKNKRAAQAAAAAAQVAGQTNGLTQRRRSGIGSSANGGSGGIGVGVDDGIDASLVATPPTGVFLGLIQRRHLVYVLTSMPCFQTAMLARDSEPMTALPYELALVGNGATKRRQSESHQDALYNDGKSSSSSSSSSLPSSNGLEVVPLDPSSSSSLASPSIMSPPRSVSHALMHGVGTGLNGGVLMNDEGASASASFVEWIAQQSAGVGQNLSAVAQQGRVDAPPTSTSASASTADERTFAHHSSLPVLPPSASTSSLVPARSPMRHHSPALDSSASLLSNSSSSSSSSSSSPSSAAPQGENLALGQDLIVQREMLANYVNLSPFIDQGAYTVSENISAKRVWSMFRSLGMRHIVVLNHQHQPVGVITRRDLIRFAVAQ